MLNGTITQISRLLSVQPIGLVRCVALWSSGRHLASGSEDPGFESWLCQVDVESLGKALYMNFLTPLMCKTSTRL